jgi:acyl-CoA thioesterase I
MASLAEGYPEMSFMRPTGPPSPNAIRDQSYGWHSAVVQIVAAAVCSAALSAATDVPRAAAQAPVKVVALGDSLTAGYGLPDKDGFVPSLQAALAAKGIDASIANAGVSGDTAADGLARLDWSVPAGTGAVIVELGANDMLRGLKPDVTRDALDAILRRLTERHIAVLLCGMRAAPNLGAAYGQAFERIYPELAAKYDVLLYPFFLDGVAADLKLNQHDGMHPNAAGVDVIVAHILPKAEDLIARVHALNPS